MLVERNHIHRPKLGVLMHSETTSLCDSNPNREDEDLNRIRHSTGSASPRNSTTTTSSTSASPYTMSPWNQASSPLNKSPWLLPSPAINLFHHHDFSESGLIGSLVREEGHIYSLAVSGELLYTGSDSKNIRVWKHLKDYTEFHESQELRGSSETQKRREGQALRRRFEPQPQRGKGLLYSGSWDKTLKVWSVTDSKCLESINAHDDAVNAVISAFGSYVFTGSADGTVKMWRREPSVKGKKTNHVLDRVLLKQENAVTALAVNRLSTVVYAGSSDGL
ncbi:WD40/YVTN repeat-like-containing domain superfamily, partial [Sesbania bispinosa]